MSIDPIEVLVRPFQASDRILARRRPKEVEPENEDATITWGRAANFNLTATDSFTTIIINDGDEPDEPEEPPSALVWTETYRATEDVRVENPDDSEQYVVVQRIREIWFVGPDGLTYIYRLNPPA